MQLLPKLESCADVAPALVVNITLPLLESKAESADAKGAIGPGHATRADHTKSRMLRSNSSTAVAQSPAGPGVASAANFARRLSLRGTVHEVEAAMHVSKVWKAGAHLTAHASGSSLNHMLHVETESGRIERQRSEALARAEQMQAEANAHTSPNKALSPVGEGDEEAEEANGETAGDAGDVNHGDANPGSDGGGVGAGSGSGTNGGVLIETGVEQGEITAGAVTDDDAGLAARSQKRGSALSPLSASPISPDKVSSVSDPFNDL